MPDYREVLFEMEKERNKIQGELDILNDGIAAVEVLMRKQMTVQVTQSNAAFHGMGTKEAILKLLSSQSEPLSAGIIAQKLLEGGIQTRSSDFVSTVRSTLHPLTNSGDVDRVEDGYRIKKLDADITISAPAPNSLAATYPNEKPLPFRQ